MTNQETVTGMVLSAMPMGDYDKRLLLLTKELGKISAFAKGARRPNSALLAAGQPFSFGTFQMYRGRSSYTVMSADITNYFTELKEDLEAVYYGFYFCEFADCLTRENQDVYDILKLLYFSLMVLQKKPINMELARYIFEIKIVSIFGEGPSVFDCIHHLNRGHSPEKEEEEYQFSPSAGGIVCRECQKNYKDLIPLSPAALYSLKYIVATPAEKLYTFTVSEQIQKELKKIAEIQRHRCIDQELKSLKMLKDLLII